MSPFLPPTRASPSTLLSLLLSQVERRRESCGGRDPLINNWICERTYLPFQTSNLRFPSFLFLPFICDLRPCMIYDVSPPASPPFSFSGLNTFQSVLFALSGREDEQPSSAVQIHSVDQSGGHSLPAACTGQASRQAGKLSIPPPPFPFRTKSLFSHFLQADAAAFSVSASRARTSSYVGTASCAPCLSTQRPAAWRWKT